MSLFATTRPSWSLLLGRSTTVVMFCFLVLSLSMSHASAASITFVQSSSATPSSPQPSVTVAFAAAQQQGDLNVVAVGWFDTTTAITSVTDTKGNAYSLAVGPTALSGIGSQSIFYAKNIAGAAANANSVKVTFSAAAPFPDVRILEYSGVDPVNPVDVVHVGSGSGGTSDSGAATTTNANDLLFGANYVFTSTTGAGPGFTNRVFTPDGDIAEDKIVTTTGSYNATAALSGSGSWIMQIVAFRAAPAGPTPTAPSNLTATPASSTQVNLAWGASTETGGTISQYLIERCQSSGCSNFAQVATVTTANYNDVGLTAATSYSYRVRAKDTSNNTGPYSNTATASTLVAIAPTAPTNLAATAFSNTQINLSWTASTESGGTISSYQIARCQGSGCSNFVQVGTAPTANFNDTGLLGATSYSYEVRAVDNLNNVGPYSSSATATTLPPTLTAPTNLRATAPGSSQINLSWTASIETGGTISGYLIERCQGSGCSIFAQVGTSTTTSYTDTGLTGGTTYSYQVRATDAANNVSTYSNIATATTSAGVSPILFVQANSSTPQSLQNPVTVTYAAAQARGDLNVVVVGWNSSAVTISSVTDSAGNVYSLAVGPTVIGGTATQAIYCAKNIAAAGANGNTVTVTFSAAPPFPDIRIAEYSGIDPTIPLDVVASAQGNGSTSDSGAVTTANPNDLLVGANYVQSSTIAAGTGYTSRGITTPDGDILEDKIVAATGSNNATAALDKSQWWIMQMVAFRAAGSSQPLPISVKVSPTTASTPAGYGTQVFGATVQNDALNKGVTWSISGSGCSGNTCGTLSNATATSVAYAAPPIVPNPASVTVTATSVTDNSKTGTAAVTVTQGSLFVAVSPKHSAVTLSQTQQFAATVYNDPQNAGVTWSVDGSNGGSAANGTITSAGLFTPGTQPGLHTVTAASNANASISASVTIAVTDLAGVFTYHYDSARTGQNLQEYALSPAILRSSTFGALFSCSVDGYVYASPLYVANLNVGGQRHNAVFIATQHDSVYAFDADSPSCVQLWQTSFLSSNVTSVPVSNTSAAGDICEGGVNCLGLELGVMSTPVIDSSTNTIYVVAHTKDTVGSGCSSGSPCYPFRLHALDLTTGIEKFGGPVVISDTNFISRQQMQRPALALSNGAVYVGFGSLDDTSDAQGWLIAYNATTLAEQWHWSAIVPVRQNNYGSIWGAGNGPAIDASGNIYVETGNGAFDGISNYSDSLVKLSPTGSVLDYFTPFDQLTLQQNDIDLGSSGPMILPDTVGSAANPHLMIATGKIGVVYLLDQTNLGKYHTTGNQDVGEVTVGLNTTNPAGGFYGQPAYWNGNIYTVIVGDSLRQYPISNASISTVSSSKSSNTFVLRGANPSVSASGTSNGIVWVIDSTGNQASSPLVLYAYDAADVTTPLYVSPASSSGAGPVATKFTVATVANGKVYVVGQYAITVFGLLPN